MNPPPDNPQVEEETAAEEASDPSNNMPDQVNDRPNLEADAIDLTDTVAAEDATANKVGPIDIISVGITLFSSSQVWNSVPTTSPFNRQ